jgi:hypothetical protein
MTNPQYQSVDTSNDVLSRLEGGHPQTSLDYWVIAQSDLEVRDLQNAPAISMSTFISDFARLTEANQPAYSDFVSLQ